MSILIVDYGVGNIGSIVNMLRKLGQSSLVSSNSEEIKKAHKIILPGVGKFDYGMQKLIDAGVIESLNERVLLDRIPILGICLGAQLMTKCSQEGEISGLGWFDAEVVKFESNSGDLRVPHMGWNYTSVQKKTQFTNNLPPELRFYFVHSYYMKPYNESDIMMTTLYGHRFASALHRDNIYATQFHPEKSHKFGLKLFQNFLDL